jgi:hypothetical protein
MLILSLCLVLLISFSYSSVIQYINREKPVEDGKDSIYTGYTTSEIASKLASVLGKEKLLNSEIERHAKIWTWNKFYYENLSIQLVLQRQQMFWWPDAEPISIHIKDEASQPNPVGSTEAEKIVYTLWNNILKKFDIDLKDTNYILILNSSDLQSKTWRIEIRQTFNDGTPLMDTGLVAWVDKNSSEIRTIEIYEWLDTKIMRPVKVSLSDAQDFLRLNINAKNSSVMHINSSMSAGKTWHNYSMYNVTIKERSDLKFDGYMYSVNRIFYILYFDLQTTEQDHHYTSRYYYHINIENGDCMLGPLYSL